MLHKLPIMVCMPTTPGQEGAGMVVAKDGKLTGMKGEGLVKEVFTAEKMKNLYGNAAIGHVRYTTAGGGGFENVQPFVFNFQNGSHGTCP